MICLNSSRAVHSYSHRKRSQSSTLLQKCNLHTHALFAMSRKSPQMSWRSWERRWKALEFRKRRLEWILPVSQFCPLKPCGHTQMFGETQEPPFRQRPSQRAAGQREDKRRWDRSRDDVRRQMDGCLTSAGGAVTGVSRFAGAAVAADGVETQSVFIAAVLPGRTLIVL